MKQDIWCIYHGQVFILSGILYHLGIVEASFACILVAILGLFAGLFGEWE